MRANTFVWSILNDRVAAPRPRRCATSATTESVILGAAASNKCKKAYWPCSRPGAPPGDSATARGQSDSQLLDSLYNTSSSVPSPPVPPPHLLFLAELGGEALGRLWTILGLRRLRPRAAPAHQHKRQTKHNIGRLVLPSCLTPTSGENGQNGRRDDGRAER